jgi:tetratricopeptide (TPR) repeat protein
MADAPVNPEADRRRAAELYATAQKLQAEGEFRAALETYKESLRLYNDEVVLAAYLKLLSGVGPA